MKIIEIKRKQTTETRHHPNMGCLSTKVTKIQKTFLGVAYKTLHHYRETYHGKTKDIADCRLAVR